MIARIRHYQASEPFDGSVNLQKASDDDYAYALGLKSGLVFTFSEARQYGEFVRLTEAKPASDPASDFYWGRPVDVRLSEIEWVGDCES